MAVYYECDRCGDLYNSANNKVFLQSSSFSRELNLEKTTVDLCPECQKPLLIFLLGFLSKTNKNFAIDRQIARRRNH